ncbi:MAG: aldehyde ferredoxin oxidoreductase C-terminal domain-containing protein [Thermodesulfobacteriota bacterium]|nr:aldehyde ferredoxin oxidoreductase C-terminal domain-containing protein [Thermodesulfobacteriota bacterium]
MTYFGYAGKEIIVDLTSNTVEKRSLDIDMAVNFLGGMGLQQRVLYDMLEPNTDPFSPKNPIIVGSGPLTGSAAPGTPRVMGTAKYPETRAIGSGGGAMRFGFMLKLAGYDHVIITGKAKSPVYLKICDDDIEICDARPLWGKDMVETTRSLWGAHGDCGVIAIGQAGEHMVTLSVAMCDLGATIGRGGFAGLMGSKNLKALVARGTGVLNIADPSRFQNAVENMFVRAKKFPLHRSIVRYGIMENWPNYSKQLGYTRNRKSIADIAKIDNEIGFEAYKKLGKKAFACPSCFIADKEIVEVRSGRFKGLKWSTPSYLNAAILASKIDLKSSGEAVRFGDVTDRYGLDQLSVSDVLDFVFTLHEEGIITEADVGGVPLRRGDVDVVLMWMKKIAYREGFGDVLADSWEGLKNYFGKEMISSRSSVIKGREGVWDPRISGVGTNEFAQLVYPRGPNAESGGTGLYTPSQPVDNVKRHAERTGMSAEAIERSFDSPLKINMGRFTTSSEHWLAIFNSLGVCNRHVNNRFYHIDIISELYSAATGVERSPQEIMECAERVWNTLKIINVREGFARKDDQPPETWFKPICAPDGEEKYTMDYFRTRRIQKEDIDQWLDDYYDERGWDKEKGIPTEKKLNELGLGYMVMDLNRAVL